MRGRIAILFVPLALALWLFRPHVASEHQLAIHFGPSGVAVREVGLHFERDLSVARDLTLNFPSGAPADVSQTVSLAHGLHNVGVRMVVAGGRELHLSRTFRVDGDARLEVDLEVR